MKSFQQKTIGLRTQLLILILLIIIPASGILLYTGYSQYRDETERIHQNAKQIINRFSNEQIRFIKHTNQLLKVLANIPEIRNNSIEPCNQILQSVHLDNPQYSTMVVASADGIINCCAIPLKKPIDVNDRSWFKRIKQSRKFVIDNFIISRSAKKASLPFAYPVLDSDGELLVAVGAAFNLNEYANIFKDFSLPEQSTIFIIDREQKTLYQSEGSKTCLGQPIEKCRGLTVPDSNSGLFEAKDIDGINRIYFYERLSVGQPENEICLLIGFSKQIVFGDVFNSLKVNFASLGMVLFISIIIAFIIGNRLFIQPINMLIQRTNAIQKGDLKRSNLVLKLPNELHTLSNAFENMVVDLAQKEVEREQATRALVISEEKYRLAMEASNDGLWDWNIETGSVFYSKAWANILSEDVVEPDYQSWDSKIHPDDKPDVLNSLQKHLNGETSYWEKEHRLKAKHGNWTWVIGRGRVVQRNHEGLPSRMVGTMIDLSDKKELESQLLQSQKLESIGTLASGIAHEFNNILSIIIGNNELIMEDLPEWSLSRESCEEIRLAGLRARDIVKHLLTFSRQDDSTKKPTNMISVVTESLKLIRSTTPTNIEIKNKIPPNCLPILGDTTQINQILINLCNNAIDALPISGGIIEIELRNSEVDQHKGVSAHKLAKGKYIRLIVRDNGSGIPQKILDRIFEPYFTTKEVGKGSGIGLAVVHGIIENHGGSITCESANGEGTTFTILLPAYEGVVEEKREPKHALPGKGERVLYVDDEPSIAKLGKRHLEALGYDAFSTTDPKEALGMIKAEPDRFDLVISDMAMPNMPGDQLITEILSINPNIPTMICSGYSSRMSETKASEMGIKAIVMKPLSKKDLAKKIREILDSNKPS